MVSCEGSGKRKSIQELVYDFSRDCDFIFRASDAVHRISKELN